MSGRRRRWYFAHSMAFAVGLQGSKQEIRKHSRMLRAYIDRGVNPALMLPKLQEEFESVVSDLEEVGVSRILFGLSGSGIHTVQPSIQEMKSYCVCSADMTLPA